MNIQLIWSVSKARDSYGYNRVTALDLETGKKYVTVGGGYDMVGTVIANLIEDKFQDKLKNLNPYYIFSTAEGVKLVGGGFYGLTLIKDKNHMVINGACGLSAVEHIIEAIGLKLKTVAKLNSRGQHVKTLGYDLIEVQNAQIS